MSAIITEKFRQHNAKQFEESFSEASSNSYYLFVGKSTPFTSATTSGSDGSPPLPSDSPADTEYYAWDSMLGAKKITSSSDRDWETNSKNLRMLQKKIPQTA